MSGIPSDQSPAEKVVPRLCDTEGNSAGIMKWSLVVLGVPVLAYALFLVAIINWPSPYRRPQAELQKDYEAAYPLGLTLVEVQGRIANQGASTEGYVKNDKTMSAVVGSYATFNMLFGIFALSEMVVVDFVFDREWKLEAVKVKKYVDAP